MKLINQIFFAVFWNKVAHELGVLRLCCLE
jgi:hypothetical protein